MIAMAVTRNQEKRVVSPLLVDETAASRTASCDEPRLRAAAAELDGSRSAAPERSAERSALGPHTLRDGSIDAMARITHAFTL